MPDIMSKETTTRWRKIIIYYNKSGKLCILKKQTMQFELKQIEKYVIYGTGSYILLLDALTRHKRLKVSYDAGMDINNKSKKQI